MKVFFWNFGNWIFQWSSIESEIYKSILLWSILFLNCALLNRFITLELLMMWRPPKVCSNVILHLHSQILDILCFKSFLDNNSFSKVHEEKRPKAICPKCSWNLSVKLSQSGCLKPLYQSTKDQLLS